MAIARPNILFLHYLFWQTAVSLGTQGLIELRERLKTLFSSTGFIVLVAFIVRMAYLYYFYRSSVDLAVRDNLQFGSEMGSVSAAIAAGRGFSSPLFKNPSGPTAWFVPIYPYLLAAIFKKFRYKLYK